MRRAKGGVFLAQVAVNGGKVGRFTVHAGASLVTLSERFAAASGLDPSRGSERYAVSFDARGELVIATRR